MIEIRDLYNSFKNVRALDGISLTAEDGQITGLIGPNGAGQTTTRRILYTVLGPDRGSAAVEACLAAIEVVDDRYSDFRELGVPTLVADDFFAAGCVLGPPVTGWRDFDLAALEAATAIDGVEIGRGHGADVMGHPLEALAWLANGMAGRGRGLRRGQFVLTGSIVAVHWLAPGESAAVEVEGLGAVRVRFD